VSGPTDPNAGEDRDLLRLAEAIADDATGLEHVTPDAATSPWLRHMAEIAETAQAFRGAAPAPAAPVPPLYRWGPLEVRRVLGEGSFGEVVAAWDPRLQREVALKLRREGAPGSARRWLEEARALARVRHPNVLTVYGADEHDGRAGMWTDLVSGRDLEAVLQQQGPFSAREAVAVGLDLCAALAAVHARGLVHGDVKTRNVMREEHGDSPGRIVLMDFGSASDASLAATAGRGTSVGTPLAMAPEVLRGEPATPAADLYSLGVLLFRLASGRYPVEAATLEELRGRLDRGEAASLRSLRPELPRSFVVVVERAIEPEPRRRFADAAAMERALLGALSGSTGRGAPRWRMPIAALALVLAAALAWRALRPPASERAAGPGPPGAPATDTPAPGRLAGAARPAVPGPAPVTLSVDATLFRSRAGDVAPLATGGEIEPGDRLFLQLFAPEKVHAYVLDEDGSGHETVLFPCAGADARNPLAAGVAHRLPGGGDTRELNWLVTSAEGRETFLVVISRRPLAVLERAVAALPAVTAGGEPQYASLGEGELGQLRGVARMVRDTLARAPGAPGRLASIARALGGRPDAGDFWIRLVRVENPND
jgi:hypothetical protein